MAEYGETPTPPKSKPPTKFEQKFIESFTKRGKTLSLKDARKRLKRGKIIAGLTFGFILLAIVAPRDKPSYPSQWKKCNSDSPECKRYSELAIKCAQYSVLAGRDESYKDEVETWCSAMETYRAFTTEIDDPNSPGAYVF